MKATCFTAMVVLILVALSLFISKAGPAQAQASTEKEELLVYCGITMIKPMSEIAAIIEKEENCRIIITKGGSGNLLRAIKVNQVGDLYLPGSDSYIKTAKDEGLIVESADVGYNKAAIMVRKGNPKHITNNLKNLANSQYMVVIGDPNSGSIGRETQKILDRRGIFEQVCHNARKLTTDSKDLVKAIRNGEADLVINWYATSTWPENKKYVDTLTIDDQYATKKRLTLGILKYSKNPEIARKFLDFASSPEGREIFDRYGLFQID